MSSAIALALGVSGGLSEVKAQTSDPLVQRGELLYNRRGCRMCHGIGKKMIAPDLMGLEQRRTKEWIYDWLKETNRMIASDSIAMGMVAQYNGARMPEQHLSDRDVEAILAYIRAQEEKIAS